MIAAKTINSWAKKLHIDPVKLKAAIDADTEVEMETPEVEVFTVDELATRDKNKFTENFPTAVEQAIKQYKTDNNLDFKGKTLKALHEAVSVKGDQEETVKKLQNTIVTTEQERDQARAEAATVKLQSKIYAFIPDLNNGMTKPEAESVMRANGFDFKEEGGAIVAYRHGAKVVDRVQSPVPANDAVKSFFETEKKWIADPDANGDGKNGGGGGNSKTKPQPKFTKASEVQKAFEDIHGVGSAMGTEKDYAGHLQKIMKEAETAGTPLIMD